MISRNVARLQKTSFSSEVSLYGHELSDLRSRAADEGGNNGEDEDGNVNGNDEDDDEEYDGDTGGCVCDFT